MATELERFRDHCRTMAESTATTKVRLDGINHDRPLRLGTISDDDRSCAICGGGPIPSRRHLDVDHNHETGVIRALLCGHCNRALGAMFDDPARLRAAADYIDFHRNGEVDKAAWLRATQGGKA